MPSRRLRSTLLVRLLPLLVAVVPAAAQAQDEVTTTVQRWFERTRRQAPGDWGIAVADQTGHVLWEHQADKPLTPASTVKLFTTGYARSVVGPEGRLPTRVVGSGFADPESGRWVGDWSLELNGDFSLESPRESGPTLRDLAIQLASAGVRELRGPLRVTSARGAADARYPAAWSPKHRGRWFAPVVGPLTVHENVVVVTVSPGRKVGARALLYGTAPSGLAPLVKVTATTRKGRRARLSLRQDRSGGWIVAGSIGLSGGARSLRVNTNDPKVVLEAAWSAALRDAGIRWVTEPLNTIGDIEPAPPRVLAQVFSPPFDSLASIVNRRSMNLGAELLLQWAGGPENAPQKLTQHVRAVTGAGDDVRFVDGSGLSYDDRATAGSFVAYLSKFPTLKEGRNFAYLLPANGEGTLRRLRSGLPAPGVVRAKTGTLGHVSAVVGYLGRPEGTLIVSLLYNGPRTWSARQAQWRLFRELGARGTIIEGDAEAQQEMPLGGDEPAGADNTRIDLPVPSLPVPALPAPKPVLLPPRAPQP